jgi:osmotically-inducible protein OsmY
MGKGKSIALAAAVGVQFGFAAAYYTDPVSGRRRRTQLRDRWAATARKVAGRLDRAGRRTRSDTIGLRQRFTHRHPDEVDDATLLDRVESELFARPNMPKGAINLEVRDGVVVLRGELATADIDRVHDAVMRIPGVRGVDDLFHLPGTPAPNKAAALRASAAPS